MNNTQTGILELSDGGNLYYEVAGEGETLVLSHAAFLDSRMFDNIWDDLTKNYRVIRYDMQGFGRSSAVSGPICRREDLRQLLDHLNVEQAHFVGCSNGGTIVLDLALEEPERARSVVMVGSTPSGYEPTGDMPRYMMEMIEAMQSGDVDTASELAIRIWLDSDSREPDELDADLRQKALDMNRIPVQQNTFFIADTQPLNPLDPPALNRLDEIQCPVLVVAGQLDHSGILHAADLMVEQIPNAQKILIDSTGHVPSFEQPEVFKAHLLDFLGKLEKSL